MPKPFFISIGWGQKHELILIPYIDPSMFVHMDPERLCLILFCFSVPLSVFIIDLIPNDFHLKSNCLASDIVLILTSYSCNMGSDTII